MTRHASSKHGFLKHHSLSLAAAAVLLLWILLYSRTGPTTHAGAFFGSAIADWTGVLVAVIATKHLYERGSAGSPQLRGHLRGGLLETVRNHSLTIFLALTGIGWAAIYFTMDPEAKWGQVIGNVLSEWTQLLGLVLLTKRFFEQRSKDSGNR